LPAVQDFCQVFTLIRVLGYGRDMLYEVHVNPAMGEAFKVLAQPREVVLGNVFAFGLRNIVVQKYIKMERRLREFFIRGSRWNDDHKQGA